MRILLYRFPHHSGSARPCQKGRDSNEGQGSSRVIFPPVYNNLQSGSRAPGMRYGVVARPRFHHQQAYIFTCSACVFWQLYTRINITNSREFCTILILPYKLTCSTHPPSQPATHIHTYIHTYIHTHTHTTRHKRYTAKPLRTAKRPLRSMTCLQQKPTILPITIGIHHDHLERYGPETSRHTGGGPRCWAHCSAGPRRCAAAKSGWKWVGGWR